MESTWITCKLEEVADVISGKNQKEVEDPSGAYPIYGSGGIFGHATEFICEPGTTIIGRKGTINSPIYVNERFWNVDTAFGIYPLNSGLETRYLHYFCCGFNFKKLDKSTTIPSLAKRDILAIRFPLPPLNEQRRIVAKIEELFSEVDAGGASLKTARAQLGVYRQSLLKQAFEGKLTEQWRTQNPDKLEPAEQLLARIRSEREARYQQQLTDWQTAVQEWEAGGLEGRKPTKPKKLKEVELITVEERKELKTLPEHWIYFRFGELISVKSGEGLTASQMKGGSFPVYGGNGVCGFHNKYLYVNSKLIIGRVGAKCGVIHITKPNSWVTDNALVGDFLVQSFDPIFYQLLLGFLDLNKLSVSTAQPVVSGAKLNPLPLPTPSLPEQQEIVRILEEQFTAIEQNEAEIDAALQRAEALRQSILKKAFAGKLVDQDPNDEPASVLLDRIRAEREAAAVAKKAAKKATKKRARKKSSRH